MLDRLLRPSDSKTPWKALCLLALLPLLAPAGAYAIWPGLQRHLRGVEVAGRVERSQVIEVQRGDEVRWQADVAIVFTWQGRARHRPAWIRRSSSKYESAAKRDVAALPVGAPVRVRVDPLELENSSLDPAFTGAELVVLAFTPLLLFFVTDDLAESLALRRRRRARTPGEPALDPGPVVAERWFGPRHACLSLLLSLVVAGLAVGLVDRSPLGALGVMLALFVPGLVGWARLLPELLHEWRWRGVRLTPADGAVSELLAVQGLPPVPGLTLRLELRSVIHDPGGEAPLWEGTVDTLPADRPLAGRLRAPAEPFGPTGPTPAWSRLRGDAPLLLEGRERRVRVVLVADDGGRRVTFDWPPPAT